MKKEIEGFKAFGKGLICRNFKYEIGKTYKEKQNIELCENGFHFCENPLDILDYYNLCDSEFAKIKSIGKVKKDNNKIVTSEIKIEAKLSLSQFINISVDFIWKKCSGAKQASSGYGAKQASSGDGAKQASSGYGAKQASSGYGAKQASSGYGAQQASSGYGAQQASSGDGAQQASSGDDAQHKITGKNSVVVCSGYNSYIQGIKGTLFALTEYKKNKKGNFVPYKIHTGKIDNKKYKENTIYIIINGKISESI